LFFSLLSFHFSLFSIIVVSREKIREKREEKNIFFVAHRQETGSAVRYFLFL